MTRPKQLRGMDYGHCESTLPRCSDHHYGPCLTRAPTTSGRTADGPRHMDSYSWLAPFNPTMND